MKMLSEVIQRAIWGSKYYFSLIENRECHELARNYDINEEFERVYLYHIRKTGGTSINHMFLSLGGEQGKEVYDSLSRSRNLRIISNDKIFVG